MVPGHSMGSLSHAGLAQLTTPTLSKSELIDEIEISTIT